MDVTCGYFSGFFSILTFFFLSMITSAMFKLWHKMIYLWNLIHLVNFMRKIESTKFTSHISVWNELRNFMFLLE